MKRVIDTTETGAEIIRFPIPATDARDELNICEFPVALLTERAPKNTYRLEYTDSLVDESTGRTVERRLTIDAPPSYGLPTAKDEEVLLALIHLTQRANGFTDPTVQFSRYELIKMLGWSESGKNYARITDSLCRWKSVTLNYKNAWRDNRAKSWVSEIFSIIDNVTIYEGDRLRASDQLNLPFSNFVWNKVFFGSMQAKYCKRLDFEFYLKLRTATAKRIFRFLDKRFGAGRSSWDFDLQIFAFQHVGLSNSYDVGKIKEKLSPAIAELEEHGFIAPLPREERYVKHPQRGWRVKFSKPSTKRVAATPQKPTEGLVASLKQRGISPAVAAKLISEFASDYIERQIDIFDWLMERHPESVRNPGGFLAEAIRRDYQPPASYRSKEEREAAAKAKEERHKHRTISKQREDERIQNDRMERSHIQSILSSLSHEEKARLEEEAIAAAEPAQHAILKDRTFGKFQRAILLDAWILTKFPMENPPPAAVG